MNEHPTPAELDALVSRALEALEEDRALLEHVSECDDCFRAYEGLWAQASGDLAELPVMFLDATAKQRLEGLLFRRIHAASLGTASSWLATDGFLHVVIALLLPIVGFKTAPTGRARGDRP